MFLNNLSAVLTTLTVKENLCVLFSLIWWPYMLLKMKGLCLYEILWCGCPLKSHELRACSEAFMLNVLSIAVFSEMGVQTKHSVKKQEDNKCSISFASGFIPHAQHFNPRPPAVWASPQSHLVYKLNWGQTSSSHFPSVYKQHLIDYKERKNVFYRQHPHPSSLPEGLCHGLRSSAHHGLQSPAWVWNMPAWPGVGACTALASKREGGCLQRSDRATGAGVRPPGCHEQGLSLDPGSQTQLCMACHQKVPVGSSSGACKIKGACLHLCPHHQGSGFMECGFPPVPPLESNLKTYFLVGRRPVPPSTRDQTTAWFAHCSHQSLTSPLTDSTDLCH